ncbi:MAG: hypothetical protein SV966_14075 [Actinomycetota bacterium]|nr:hypothetical protein [Actinomycetota bacterium]
MRPEVLRRLHNSGAPVPYGVLCINKSTATRHVRIVRDYRILRAAVT